MQKAAGRRGRRLSFDREQALDAALRLFWARGYEGTSVADLLKMMNITPPSLYAAFGSKEALYREALERYRDVYAAFVAEALGGASSAHRAITRLLHQAALNYCSPDTPQGCMVSISVLSCAPENEGVATVVAGMRDSTVNAIAARLATARDAGEIPLHVDIFGFARFIAAIIQGMSVQARDGADHASLMAIADSAMAAWPGRSAAGGTT